MKKLLLFATILAGVVILACNKATILPTVNPTPLFVVTSKMSHAKDTIKAAGDTITITAQGNIYDTSRTYAISANFKAADSVTKTLLGAMYVKSLTLTFDTAGIATSGLYHWKSTVAFPIPAVTAKTKIQTTATFGFGLNTSSRLGNVAATDSKYTYAK